MGRYVYRAPEVHRCVPGGVDTYGYHWAWLGDAWAWHFYEEAIPGPRDMFPFYHEWHKVPRGVENKRREENEYGPGPFMEAVHHRAVWGKEWKRTW